jgi:hypothetical protein
VIIFSATENAFSSRGARRWTADDPPAYTSFSVPDLKLQLSITEPRLFWAGPVVFAPDGSFAATRLAGTGAVWRGADLAPVSRFNEGNNNLAFWRTARSRRSAGRCTTR